MATDTSPASPETSAASPCAPPGPAVATSTEAASVLHVLLHSPASAPASGAAPPVEAPPSSAPVAERPASDAPLDTLLRQRLASPMSEEHQQELAQLMDLREEAGRLLGPRAVQQVELGLYALLGEQPNLPFAQAIRARLTSRLADRTRPLQLSALMRTDSPPMQVLLGLGAALACTGILGGLAHWNVMSAQWTLFKLPPHLLILTALGGVVGSVASILVRIRDFDEARGATPASMLLLGFSKPVVGACFALFMLAVLKAELVPIKLPAEGPIESYFFLAVSFVCGFSERLAQDIVARLEDGLSPDEKPVEAPMPASEAQRAP